MQCIGEFVFKSLNKRDGGEFVNDRGEKIQYDPCYSIKCDENTVNGIIERKLKFPISNKTLADKLRNLPPYTKINLICDVILYNSNAKVLPIDLSEEG